jgi:hypothetical protein
MNMLTNKKLGVLKLALVAFAFATVSATFRPATAQAAPICGPAELARVANAACEKVKPTLKDILLGAILPGVGVTKAALYGACKSVANSGYLVDALFRGCCQTHDACYSRGGDLSCKNGCDAQFYQCTHTSLGTLLGGNMIADAVVAAATVGGFGTFNYNENRCN